MTILVHIDDPGGATDGSICRIVIDRPQAANAIDLMTLTALIDAIAKASVDDNLSAIVLAAAGTRHFCAGADTRESRTPDEAVRFRRGLGDMLCAIAATEKPVVAAVGGAASGAGAMIACVVDAVVMAEPAYLAFPEIAVGVPPILAFELASSCFGATIARSLVTTGRSMPASECLRLGLAAKVVAAEDVLTTARRTAAALGAKPREPFALYKRHLASRHIPLVRGALEAMYP